MMFNEGAMMPGQMAPMAGSALPLGWDGLASPALALLILHVRMWHDGLRLGRCTKRAGSPSWQLA